VHIDSLSVHFARVTVILVRYFFGSRVADIIVVSSGAV